MIILHIPLKTVSEFNDSSHWSQKSKRHKNQRKSIWAAFKEGNVRVDLPCHVKITRYSPGTLDSDNLQGSLKFVRDSIADNLIPGLDPGRADDSSQISWSYDQIKSKDYAVRIDIQDVPF